MGDTREAILQLKYANVEWKKLANHAAWPEERAALLRAELNLYRHLGRGTDILQKLDAADWAGGVVEGWASRSIAFARAGLPGIRVLLERGHFKQALELAEALVGNADELRAAFDDYQSLLGGEASPVHTMVGTAAIRVLQEHLIPVAASQFEATQLRTLGLEIVRAAIVSAEHERQFDLAQTLRSQHARLLCQLSRFDEAREQLEQNLAWSEQNEGPSRVCQRHLELADVYAKQGHHHQALGEVARAREALEREIVDFQPRAVWRALLLGHAGIFAATGQVVQARALQTEAREQMAAAGLPAEELIVLHVLAEPLPGESIDSLDSREQAAAAALALAAPAGLIYEEARALANFALVHAERGRRAPATKMLAEARWLAEDLAYGPIREHIDRVTAAVDAVLASST